MSHTTASVQSSVVRTAVGTGVLLLVPLVAMQFSNQVNWTLLDFSTATALLFGAGLIYELGVKRVRQEHYRTVLTGVVLVALVCVWVQLAVGIFD